VPCHGPTTRILESAANKLVLNNLTLNIIPRAEDGTLHPTSFVSVTLHGFQELYRPGITCYELADEFPLTGNPALVQPLLAIQTSEMMCDYELVEWQGPGGIEVQTLYILATHPAHANFSLDFNVTIASQDFNETSHYSPTQDRSYISKYQENQPKFAFQLNNWPWESTDPNSYIYAYWNLDYNIPGEFSINSSRVGNTTYLQMKSLDGELQYIYEVEQSFVADDLILVRQLNDTVFQLPSVTMESIEVTLMRYLGISFSFCELRAPGFQYDTLFYDPTLAAIFTPTPTPQNEQAKKGSSGLSGPQIAGIVIACVIVAGIAALLVTLWLKPDLKTVFRPFRER
jgi:hypothetical protein